MDPLVDAADCDGGDENISVCLRIRQFTADEISRHDKVALTCTDGRTVTVRGKLPDRDDKEISCSYTLTCALTQTCSQSEMFDRCGIRDLLDSCVNGYSSTVFAYGQTGSGKTYTIVGPEQQVDTLESRSSDVDGIIARAVKYLFRAIEKRSDATYRVECSYLELYNEQVRDLVAGTGDQLGVKFDPQKNTFYVDKLSIIPCKNKRDVMRVFSRGFKRTRVASHDLNSRSNRSHCVFTVHLHCEPTTALDDAEKAVRSRHGKISFVDLAGSERIKQTGAVGKTAKESGQINKSLFTLGKVISVLADNKPGKFVPYRDSKLTMLLMDSIGGNAKTLMIACCSPSDFHLYESLRCLEFASRTKNIRNKPVIQRDPTQNLIFELKREIKKLREQNKQLQGAVMSSLAAINSSQPNPNPLQPSNLSRTSVSLSASSEPTRRQAAVHLHLFDSDSENDADTPAPFAKTAVKPPPAKAERERPHAEDEPANADLISRTQWFLQMHQDKPQDTYEKLLFDELKTLVAEYSVTRKTSVPHREGMPFSSSKLVTPISSVGAKSQFEFSAPIQPQSQYIGNQINGSGGLGWDPDVHLQEALRQRAASSASQRQQGNFVFGHISSSQKMNANRTLDSSPEEKVRMAVGPASAVERSPPSSHGLNKRFGQDPSRQEFSSHSGLSRLVSASRSAAGSSSGKHGETDVSLQPQYRYDENEDDFDLMMAGNQYDKDSALLEIEQLKAELDRESAAFQGSIRMQQLYQTQQQQLLYQQQQQHQQHRKQAHLLPLISENRGSPQRRDHGSEAEPSRRRQHQRASHSISLSSATTWAPSSQSPPQSRLQTSNFQSRGIEQHGHQRLVRSETGAAEKEGWKNRVNKAEAAIRNHMAEMSNWFGGK